MRKTFNIIVENREPERQVDYIKHQVKKYLGRERRKKLADGVDYWDFDCRIGVTSELASAIPVGHINKAISKIVEEKNETFYLEILAKPGIRSKKAE